MSEVSLAGSHGCVVTLNGGVVCWGSNSFGELGAVADATAAKKGVFVTKEVGGELSGVSHVRTGDLRNCALTSQGALWCWGENGTHTVSSLVTGSLGVGDQVQHTGAVQVNLSNVVDVAIGLWHACALVKGGQVYCWGTTGFVGVGAGASGDGTGGVFVAPQRVQGLDDVVEIRAGQGHTCARSRNGEVACWGTNDKGQLGDGTAVTRFSPTPVVGLY